VESNQDLTYQSLAERLLILRSLIITGDFLRIKLTSVYVDDQEKALKFYTEMLGFIKKADISAGGYRWLTVVSPEDQNGVELVLEPNQNPAAKTYQQALFKQGIRAAAFFVDDVQKEFERLKKLGVNFAMEPTKLIGTPSTIAVLDDTCGNLIQITHIQT
jgi:predicted enzyme related to lactoylglutathione lyase